MPRATYTASPAFAPNEVPVAEKLGAAAPAAPIETPVPFPVTDPPESVVGASASARMPVVAPETVPPLIDTGQEPEARSPLLKRTTGGPAALEEMATLESDTEAVSAGSGQLVSIPGPVEAEFRTSNPAMADPGPRVTKALPSAAPVVTA